MFEGFVCGIGIQFSITATTTTGLPAVLIPVILTTYCLCHELRKHWFVVRLILYILHIFHSLNPKGLITTYPLLYGLMYVDRLRWGHSHFSFSLSHTSHTTQARKPTTINHNNAANKTQRASAQETI